MSSLSFKYQFENVLIFFTCKHSIPGLQNALYTITINNSATSKSFNIMGTTTDLAIREEASNINDSGELLREQFWLVHTNFCPLRQSNSYQVSQLFSILHCSVMEKELTKRVYKNRNKRVSIKVIVTSEEQTK